MSLNIEGDLGHIEMMDEFWKKYGADLNANHARHAVVSARDGWAYFPIINSQKDWGAATAAWSERADDLDAHITMSERARKDRIAANNGAPLEFRTVKAFSLGSLLLEIGPVNYIHCDIQGFEGEVFCSNMDDMDKNAMISCISTHNAEVEKQLSDAFLAHGWDLEASWVRQPRRDGTFIWSNSRF